MSKIKIKISPGGKTTTTVVGAPGGACHVASKPYAGIFAGNVVSNTPTEEASQPEITTEETQHEQQH